MTKKIKKKVHIKILPVIIILLVLIVVFFIFQYVSNLPIKNIYIGDNNNTAQLADAYLYDESQTAWVNVNTGEVLTE